MKIKYFYDEDSNTFSYLIIDCSTKSCAIIDSVLGYNIYTGKFNTLFADKILNYVRKNKLKCEWILETHIHADHITAAKYLKSKLNSKIGIGEGVKCVFDHWKKVFNFKTEKFNYFDKLFYDNEIINIGKIKVKIMFTPGHTPGCISYYIKDNIFVGDTLFMPRSGTARTDFPGGCASQLFESIKKILKLPNKTKIFICHDYPIIKGKEECVSTVETQNTENVLINYKISKSKFVRIRNKRDKKKNPPKFIYPALQLNIRSGHFGKKESNGLHYIKVPVIN
jgi:glyoxylase-like metal-dependent hydrolase (beta-lactamase superfamily II)